MRSCCVSGCAGNTLGGVKMFMFPKIHHLTETSKELLRQRQHAWLSALGKTDDDLNYYKKFQICDIHFISGKMASLQDINNLDWVPTMNLQNPNKSCSDILRCSIVGCMVSNQGGQCSFYRIPKINSHGELKVFSEKKLSAWISALGLQHDEPETYENIYVCHAHYIIEMSGKLRDTSNSETISLEIETPYFASDAESTDCTIPGESLNVSTKKKRPRNQPATTAIKSDSQFFKTGEILRNDNGKFSFSCSYCDALKDDCRDMINHINRHFDENLDFNMSTKLDAPLPLPEFVSCTVTDDVKPEPECSETFREVTNTICPTKASKPSQEASGVACTTVSVKSPTPRPLKRRLVPKINIEVLAASRPCKIKKIDIVDAQNPTPIKDATATPTFKLPILPIKIGPMPQTYTGPVTKLKELTAPTRPGWYFGKNYEILYKNKNPNICLTLAKDLGKRIDLTNPEVLKCYQCRLEPAVGESDPRPHQCKECKDCFPNHIDYRTHFVETHRYQSSVRCYQCEMEPSVPNESDARRHKCVICKEWLPNHIEFKTHLKDEHDEHMLDNDFSALANDYKEFTCYICEKSLKQREYLVFHMKGHFEKYLEYQCHLCGLRLRSESVLKEHMKRHENNPTECDVCNKVFPNYMRMRTHRMCHTSELKYECTVCSKSFKLSKYLRRHYAVHNEDKIFCRYCDASFKFSTGRRAHEKSLHNVL